MIDPAVAQVRDAAIDRVEAAVPVDWFRVALMAVRDCAKTYSEFTTDEVLTMLARQGVSRPPEPRAMGAVMRRARGLQYIAPTGRFRPTTRVSRHGAPIRIWRSTGI